MFRSAYQMLVLIFFNLLHSGLGTSLLSNVTKASPAPDPFESEGYSLGSPFLVAIILGSVGGLLLLLAVPWYYFVVRKKVRFSAQNRRKSIVGGLNITDILRAAEVQNPTFSCALIYLLKFSLYVGYLIALTIAMYNARNGARSFQMVDAVRKTFAKGCLLYTSPSPRD